MKPIKISAFVFTSWHDDDYSCELIIAKILEQKFVEGYLLYLSKSSFPAILTRGWGIRVSGDPIPCYKLPPYLP